MSCLLYHHFKTFLKAFLLPFLGTTRARDTIIVQITVAVWALHGEEVGLEVEVVPVCRWEEDLDRLEPELPPDSAEQDEDS